LSVNGCFPMQAIANVSNNTGAWSTSWADSILPNIELNALYNALNFNLVMTDNANTTVGYSYVATYLCPSESIQARPAPSWAPLNYACNVGGPGSISTWSGTI